MSEARRILILSVKAGAGHLRAAQAVEEVIRNRFPRVDVRHAEALEYTNKAFRAAFSAGYEKLARDLPAVWGLLYASLEDKPPESKSKAFSQLLDRLNAAPLLAMVRDYAPDAIVCTHYLPAEVLGPKRLKGELEAPLYVTLTDFCIHSMWIQDGTDHYFVASEEMAYALQARGIGHAGVSVTGIPIRPVFSAVYPPKPELRDRLGLDPDATTVLLSAGGFGLSDIDKTVRFLAEKFDRVQFLAVAGANEKLRDSLTGVAERHPRRIIAYGFVENMHELMAASDLAVAKSGGLTSSECLAMGLPMVILKPIPGQEERNADYLLECGAAVRAHSSAHLIFKLDLLVNDRERLATMAEAARRTARPRAAHTIAELAVRGVPA